MNEEARESLRRQSRGILQTLEHVGERRGLRLSAHQHEHAARAKITHVDFRRPCADAAAVGRVAEVA